MNKLRIPMLLSAFACPGAGQFIQKRWFAGVMYSTGFLIGFVWVMVIAVKIIIAFYQMAYDFDSQPDVPGARAMIPPLLIAMVFYIGNLFDVYYASLRQGRSDREKQVLGKSS